MSIDGSATAFRLKLECPHCATICVVELSPWSMSLECGSCGDRLGGLRRFKGYVYILANPRRDGVKIGHTNGSPFSRAKKLSSTGVNGIIEVAAFFTSFDPKNDEQKVHEKLRRFHSFKEHLDLQPAEATAKTASCLGRDPHYLSNHWKYEFASLRKFNKELIEKRLSRNVAAPSSFQFTFADGFDGCPTSEPTDETA